jgi:hypothetical protein
MAFPPRGDRDLETGRFPVATSGDGTTSLPRCGVFAALILLALGLLPLPIFAQDDGSVIGRVLDFTNAAPVVSAEVEILDPHGVRIAATTTGSDGGFRLDRIVPGPYRLHARSLGYESVTTPSITVGSGVMTEVIIWVAIDAVPLAPLEVVAGSVPLSANPLLNTFLQRVANRTHRGTYILSEEIRLRQPQRLTDLLATLPSLTATQEVVWNNRTNCPPTVWLDGVRIYRAERGPAESSASSAFEVINSISPHSLEGFEWYPGASSLPHEYTGPSAGCGVLAFWTKRGG